MLARTVTRLTAMTWMPSLATAATRGVVMTLGFTLICTASKTSRPARSIAAARSKSRGMLALRAEIRALTTLGTLPPARKWLSSWLVVRWRPALWELISASITTPGGTRRRRMPISVPMPTGTPEESAAIQSRIGMK